MRRTLLPTRFPLARCSPVAATRRYLGLVEHLLSEPSSKTFNDCIQLPGDLPVFVQVRICQDLQRVKAKPWARACASSLLESLQVSQLDKVTGFGLDMAWCPAISRRLLFFHLSQMSKASFWQLLLFSHETTGDPRVALLAV